MNRQIFASISIILVIAVLGTIGYLGYKGILPKLQILFWKTHVNSNPTYSIKYPSDWKINDSDGILLISKKDARLRIISHSIGSSAIKFPLICQFPDSAYKGNLIADKYAEIKSNNNVYRVTQSLPITGSQGGFYYQVCFEKTDVKKFTDKMGQISIDYIFFDNEDFKTMNLMLSTFR